MVEILGRKWTIRFDRSTTAASNGIRVILSCEDGDNIPLSFKLEFPCSNNTTEYEVYLTGLAIALSMGINHLRVLGDSNLVLSQVKRDFALRSKA